MEPNEVEKRQPKVPEQAHTEEPRPRPKLRIVKLEERIAPFGCCDDCGNDLL